MYPKKADFSFTKVTSAKWLESSNSQYWATHVDKYGDKYGIEQYKTRSGLEFLCQPVYDDSKSNNYKFVLKNAVHNDFN